MKKNEEKKTYWELRALAQEQKTNDKAKSLEITIASSYRRAQKYLIDQARKLFARAQKQSELPEEELRRVLNSKVEPAELFELRKLTQDITNEELQQEAQQRLKALAFKERITRVEELKVKSYVISKQLANIQLDKQTDFYIDIIHDSYKEASAEAIVQKAVSESKGDSVVKVWEKNGFKLKELPTASTKNILESHWHGSNYSKRLWGDTEALAKRLEELFTIESITGMSEREMAQAIAKEFERSIGVARRLIRTEANYMANQAKLKAWKDRGIEQYIIIAVLDLRTSEICRNKDGLIFKVSEAKVEGIDGTFPPFHPWCRTIAGAYFGERTLTGVRFAINPINGEAMKISQRTTYNQWMNMIKEKYSDEEIDKQRKKIKKSIKIVA